MASSDPFQPAPGGVHSSADLAARADARNTEIQRLTDAGGTDEFLAERVSAAVDAHAADVASYMESVTAGTAQIVTGSGAPRPAVVEALLGTPAGDFYAGTYGFDLGEYSRDQIMMMKQNGLSWAEITRRCLARRGASRPGGRAG